MRVPDADQSESAQIQPSKLAGPTEIPQPLQPAPTLTPAPVAPTIAPLPNAAKTSAPEPTTAARPILRVLADRLNVREGPSTDYAAVTQVTSGTILTPIEIGPDSTWFQVQLDSGRIGWVAASLVELSTKQVKLPSVSAPPLPACTTPADPSFANTWQRSEFGCATSVTQTVWAAWQFFERGGMLWRSDTDQAYAFFTEDGWSALPERWKEGVPIASRGNPPAGRQAPVRGFGYVWGQRDDVFNGLGWAIDSEKGFCATVQSFEYGFMFRSSTVEFCQDQLYNNARQPGWSPTLLSARDNGYWR